MISLDSFFKGVPQVHESAPGRVNLLGEHTDYNDGFMLPIATPQRTEVAASLSEDDAFHLYSASLDLSVMLIGGGHVTSGFGLYIEGCICVLQRRGVTVPPLRIYVRSTLPIGAGLSSSAALEVATLRALRRLLGFDLDDVALALLAQNAEIAYAGVNCGIMDQMAASLADNEHMLFLDARTLQNRLLPLPIDTELIVIDSGVARTLAASKYNERRAECEAAARALGVRALRDVGDPAVLSRLDQPYRRRAQHVVSENLRVLAACEGVSAAEFGRLMNASHASLRDDYEVSVPELDELTALLRAREDVFGARLTGAGFGGACVALCRRGHAADIADAVLSAYNAQGRHGSLLIPEPIPNIMR